jgi:hypothetical protein
LTLSDFDINLVGIIDTQQMLKTVLRQLELGNHRQLHSHFLQIDKLDWLTKVVGGDLLNLSTNTMMDFQRKTNNLIGLTALINLYLTGLQDPPDCTFVGCRIRPLINSDKIYYAKYDVVALLCTWQEMKHLVITK